MSDHVLIFRLACYVFVYPGLILLLKTKSNPSIWLLRWLNVFSSEVKPQPFQLGGASAGWASRTCPCPQVEDLTQDSTRSAGGLPCGQLSRASAECCSFSAVSAPIFATKYAFCNIFQNLPDYIRLYSWNCLILSANFGNICKTFCWNFAKIIADFLKRFFSKILRLQRCKSMQIL